MFFVLISFTFGAQCKPSFQWNMGLKKLSIWNFRIMDSGSRIIFVVVSVVSVVIIIIIVVVVEGFVL